MAKMWAGRTSGVTDSIADDFNSSIRFDCRMFRQDITGSMAHAAMLGAKHIITQAEADVLIDGENVTLSVNHPYARTWSEDIYLTGYDSEDDRVSCVLQVVRHPWKWPMATGIVMLIAGAIMMFVQGPKRQDI